MFVTYTLLNTQFVNNVRYLLDRQAIKIAQEVTGQKDEKKAITLFVEKINAPQMFFATDIPHEESDARAHKLCNKKDSAQKNCPKRWAAMQKWFEFAKQVQYLALDSNV